jgi:hypothetical protein
LHLFCLPYVPLAPTTSFSRFGHPNNYALPYVVFSHPVLHPSS